MITLEGGIGNQIMFKGKVYSYFAGNNYLGLANHPAIKEEASVALEKYGVNFAASRQTTGTSELHLELEGLLAGFKNCEDAVVFASGYMGNRLLLHALRERYDLVLADSSAHPSITDGIPGDVLKVSFYDHCNPAHLEDLLKKSGKLRSLIITDGIFALTGEIAPLDRICNLAKKYNSLVIVDDAHATGVLGTNGRGTPEHFGLNETDDLFQSETLSKALGSYGGFIAAGQKLIDKIREGSKFYGASTSLPPPVVAAGCASIRLIMDHPELRDKLRENTCQLRNGITEMDYATNTGITPIIPVFFEEQQNAINLSSFLEENQIIAPAVNYPVELDHFIVRITVSANHTKDQIENLLCKLKKWRENNKQLFSKRLPGQAISSIS